MLEMSPNNNYEDTVRLTRDAINAAREGSPVKAPKIVDQEKLAEGEIILRGEIKEFFKEMDEIKSSTLDALTKMATLQNRYSEFEKLVHDMIEVGYLTEVDGKKSCDTMIVKFLAAPKTDK